MDLTNAGRIPLTLTIPFRLSPPWMELKIQGMLVRLLNANEQIDMVVNGDVLCTQSLMEAMMFIAKSIKPFSEAADDEITWYVSKNCFDDPLDHYNEMRDQLATFIQEHSPVLERFEHEMNNPEANPRILIIDSGDMDKPSLRCRRALAVRAASLSLEAHFHAIESKGSAPHNLGTLRLAVEQLAPRCVLVHEGDSYRYFGDTAKRYIRSIIERHTNVVFRHEFDESLDSPCPNCACTLTCDEIRDALFSLRKKVRHDAVKS